MPLLSMHKFLKSNLKQKLMKMMVMAFLPDRRSWFQFSQPNLGHDY